MSTAAPEPGPRGPVPVGASSQRLFAWAFRPFARVHPAEVALVAAMTLTSFLLLTAYYLLKTVREPLILLQGGAEVKLYARAAQALIMLGVVHVYGELARRFGRAKLLTIVFLFFISNLVLFAILARTSLQIGLAFFLWVGVFSYTVVAQFWALAADICTDEQGKRLFPIIGGGSSVGGVAGALLASLLVPFGPHVLMGTAVVILLACVALIGWVQRRAAGGGGGHKTAVREEPLSREGAFQLLIRDKYLLLIGGLVILLNWVNSSGEYLLDRVLLSAAAEAQASGGSAQAFIGAFKADYFAWFNTLGMLLQLFAVSRILQLVGVRRALLFLPGFALMAYGAAVAFPILAVVRLVKIGENSLQYSLQDTTRHALFLVGTREEKFVGKTAVDTVAVRLGAIMSTLMVLLGTHLGWPTATFAAINVVLAVLWIGFVLLIGREHRQRSEGERPRSSERPFPGESQRRLVMQDQHTSGSRPAVARVSAGLMVAAFVGLTLSADASALPQAEAASGAERRTVTVGHYGAGAVQRFFLGSGYRRIWMSPVSVEVLDLTKEKGGLRPLARVGGQETKVLALVGADGRSYTFRGLVKDASHVLDDIDPLLKDSPVVRKIIDDLMSAQHPASDLVSSGILEAAGIPCQAWRLVVMPDDPALGAFRNDFKDVVGVFAEYPQPAKGALPGFLGATEIIDHLELYKRLEAGEGDAVDAKALLRARLVDIFMGDWDRHRKQWRWAKQPGNPLWVPIPEDRDQAFSRYEGYALDRARGRDPRFQSFGPRYAGIGGLTFNGWDQDRRLLTGFERGDFVEAAREVAGRLTDAAIEAAARRMPPEWYAKDGPRLVSDLRARRDALPEVAEKYYRHLAGRVDVYMTNRSERVDAVRAANGDMEVTIRVLDAGGQPGARTYHRVFHERETEEVRFYALGGDDAVVLTGGRRGPRVRMIGGKGDDTLDTTAAGNAKLSDSEGRNRALGAAYDDKPYHAPPPPKNAPWIPPRDFTRETWGTPLAAYNADMGLFLGYALVQQRYGFRKSPDASLQRLAAGYAFQQKGAHAEYDGDFPRENSRFSFNVHAYASSVEVLRFYGFGNETEATEGQKFYRVHANQYLLYPSFRFAFGSSGELRIGPALKYTSNDQSRDEYINTVNPYGVGGFGELGAHAVLAWDARDNKVLPRRGLFAAVRGTWFAQAWDVASDFGQVNGNLNAYLPLGARATLALRGGGKKVFGTYPYMEAASLGQGGLGAGALEEPENTLRGYRARRFSGDSSTYGNADLRLRISNMDIIVPGVWGLTAFGDVGRVWYEGESSDKWHTGVGGGLWFCWLTNRLSASVGFSHSKEEDLVYFTGGFHF